MDDEDLIENLFGFEDISNSSEDERNEKINQTEENTKTTTTTTTENNEQAQKPKRVIRRNIPKFDSSSLLSENGLVKLQTLISKTSFKRGKGHERENLNRLINVYQLWGHSLYPRYKFKSIIERAEKLCSEKRLKIAYLAWKESNKYMNMDKENYNNNIDNDENNMIEDNIIYDENNFMETFNNNTNFNNNNNNKNINHNNNFSLNNTNNNNIINENPINSQEANNSSSSIPISRLPHPLTDEERAFIIANKERALRKLREKKEALAQKKKMQEMENNIASTSSVSIH